MTIGLVSFCLILCPASFGMAKTLVGASCGRPVGILCAMVFLTVVFGAWSVVRQPYRTRVGGAALKRAKSAIARAARAPLEAEISLAFAVSGAVVLAGTPCQAFRKLMPSGGDGTGSGGDGGGSGCGGYSAD